MRKKSFKGEVLAGHKEHAIEVPFDPTAEWGIAPKALWRGRRGHLVNATVNGFSFSGSIVPRQKRFYLLIDTEAKKAAGVVAGIVVQVEVKPSAQ
jgi:hypothetical protein